MPWHRRGLSRDGRVPASAWPSSLITGAAVRTMTHAWCEASRAARGTHQALTSRSAPTSGPPSLSSPRDWSAS